MKEQEQTTTEEKPEELSRYEQIKRGLVEPVGSEKGWLNMEKRVSFNMMPEEKRKEICRKGAEAVNALHGEKKTARQSLERILTIKATPEIIAQAELSDELAEKLRRDNPNATLYDLIQLVAVGRAVSGNMKAYELIRDTHGDKPVDKVEVTDNVTTESDRELMRQIAERLDGAESVHIVESPQIQDS